MSGELRSVFAAFDVTFNTDALDAGAKSVDTLVGKLASAAKAFAGFALVKGVIAWGEHVAEAAREVEFGAIKAGMGTDEFQKLNQVAERYGSTAEQLTISTRLFIRGLSDAHGTMGEFGTRTNHAQHAMKSLGINAAQFKGLTLDKILPVIADGFQKIGKGTEATAIGLRLFGHRGIGILPLMLKGGENFRKEMQAMQPIFEEATIETADRAVLSAKALSNTWQHFIVNVFGRPLLNAMAKGADALDRVVKVVYELAKTSNVGEATLITLSAALTAAGIAGAIAFWAWLWPLAAAAAAFAAIVIAVDDFIGFMEGKDSLLGDFFDKLLGPGGAEKAQEFFKHIGEDIQKFIDNWNAADFRDIFEIASKGAGRFMDLLRGIKDALVWLDTKTGLFSHFFDSTGEIAEKAKTAKARWDVDHPNEPFPGLFEVEHRYKTGFVGPPAPYDIAPPPLAPMSVAPRNFVETVPTPYGNAGEPRISQIFTVNGGDPHEVREAARQGAQEALDQHYRDALSASGGAR